MTPKVYYFSDVLCVWAYVAHARLEQLGRQFGTDIEIDGRYCSVFGDTHGKIEAVWADRGGFDGFNAHLKDVASRFPHAPVHDRLWLDVRPRSSTSPHLFLKAVQLIEEEDQPAGASPYLETLYHRASWAMRRAFFEHAQDIADWQVHRDIANQLGIDYGRIAGVIESARAIARLDADQRLSDSHQIEGSPTILMNNGRQKLYGNVGYRLIEANVEEMLRRPIEDEASWC